MVVKNITYIRPFAVKSKCLSLKCSLDFPHTLLNTIQSFLQTVLLVSVSASDQNRSIFFATRRYRLCSHKPFFILSCLTNFVSAIEKKWGQKNITTKKAITPKSQLLDIISVAYVRIAVYL